MKTYWDLSEKERAALSREDVERFVDAELMLKGVLKVSPPQLDPEPNVTLPEGSIFYRPRSVDKRYGMRDGFDVAFEKPEHVAAFLALKPYRVRNHYMNGTNVETASELQASEADFQVEKLPKEDEVLASRTEYERLNAVREGNAKKRSQFEQESRSQEQALAGLWEDWNECRGKQREMLRVKETFDAYVRTAEGDQQIAARFLRKVFDELTIIAAEEWFGFTVPEVADVTFAAPVEASAEDITF